MPCFQRSLLLESGSMVAVCMAASMVFFSTALTGLFHHCSSLHKMFLPRASNPACFAKGIEAPQRDCYFSPVRSGAKDTPAHVFGLLARSDSPFASSAVIGKVESSAFIS